MKQSTYFKDIKRIAIVAYHDTRKDLIEWSYANKQSLSSHIIISTARTASILEGTLNTPVLNLSHGKSGGYQQIKNLLDDNKIDIIIFFGNPMLQEDRDSWFDELVNVAIRQNVVVAYNQATIDMLLDAISIRKNEAPANNEFIELLRSQMVRESNGVVTLK